MTRNLTTRAVTCAKRAESHHSQVDIGIKAYSDIA